MFDKIVYISDHSANIRLKDAEHLAVNLMNLHLIFEDKDKKVLGEVDDLDKDIVKARFLGEIVHGKLIGGTIRKPALDASIRVIDKSEIPMIVGEDREGYMKFGVSPFYNDFPVYLDVNNFFSNHFAIFGNSGSGKSCGVSRLFQNMFHDQRLFPYKANILLFDSSGEYYNAFNNLNSINPNYHYRFFSTNEVDGIGEKLRLPIWLLNANDLALLLQATNHSQLPIIERMLKLALIFSQTDMDANNYKNHLIAKAIMTILYTNETSPNKRNEIFSILASCSTPQFNLEATVQGIGYTRKFRECFLIDSQGQFSESVLLTEYVSSFIKNEYDNYEPKGGVFYTLDTLEKALNFTLISEGWLRNENTYGDAVTIKVRLHSLIVGENAKYFDVPDYISLESYLSSLLINNGRKYQLVNFNLDDVDDDFAKVITKIYSRLVFEFAKGLKDRASIPFHIIVEEAHRYIQNDTDRFLIGYNIFERIAKEGRKYGVLLGLISQRPVELSDTVISQCSNFLIFKMNHPTDVDYIRKMVPNISDEIVEKQKTLQAGTCLGFGMAFKIPLICKLQMPDPAPWSGNCDVVTIWNGNGNSNRSNNVQRIMPDTSTVSFEQGSSSSGIQNTQGFPEMGFLNNMNSALTTTSSGNSSVENGSSRKPLVEMTDTSNSSVGMAEVNTDSSNFSTMDSNQSMPELTNSSKNDLEGVVDFNREKEDSDNLISSNHSMTSQSSDLGIPGLKIANPAGMMSEDEQKSFSVLSNDVDDEDKQKESDNGVEDDSSGFSSLNGTPLVAITPDDMLE
ncbi:MAG TPA: DUF87 domain-containing protein [Candidatus Faecimonas gallistercoris]|nr:DUF87 domain-containing protein [Candidatus Faecimonas gallistercoris]